MDLPLVSFNYHKVTKEKIRVIEFLVNPNTFYGTRKDGVNVP